MFFYCSIKCFLILLFNVTFVIIGFLKIYYTMINSVTFATRLKTIMEYYDLSASAFSEKIDFNRSTISHILSGRNKPSLEFVMKILEHFPEVTTSWLLYNKGDFPKHTSGAVKEPHVNTIPNNKEIKENPTEAAPS